VYTWSSRSSQHQFIFKPFFVASSFFQNSFFQNSFFQSRGRGPIFFQNDEIIELCLSRPVKLTHAKQTPHPGCQIFLGPKKQNGEKCTKLPQNIPNGHKIFSMAVKYVDQKDIKYTKIFRSNTLQNLPKLGFWV
jgi:hypothetical protein